MEAKQVKRFAKELYKHRHNSDVRVVKLLHRQLQALLNSASDNLTYQSKLNNILNGVDKLDTVKSIDLTLKAYHYFYLELTKRANHLYYPFQKAMKAYDAHKPINMYKVGQNILLKKFGLGNPYHVLDVHTVGIVRSEMNLVVTYE